MKIYAGAEKTIANPLYDGFIKRNHLQQKWMIKRGIKSDRIFYIPPCIHSDTWKKISPESFLKKTKLKGKTIITYLGRIQEYKGLDQVIKILPNLIKLDKKLIFIMIGPDFGDKKRLQKIAKELKAENHILFTGKVAAITGKIPHPGLLPGSIYADLICLMEGSFTNILYSHLSVLAH